MKGRCTGHDLSTGIVCTLHKRADPHLQLGVLAKKAHPFDDLPVRINNPFGWLPEKLVTAGTDEN